MAKCGTSSPQMRGKNGFMLGLAGCRFLPRRAHLPSSRTDNTKPWSTICKTPPLPSHNSTIPQYQKHNWRDRAKCMKGTTDIYAVSIFRHATSSSLPGSTPSVRLNDINIPRFATHTPSLSSPAPFTIALSFLPLQSPSPIPHNQSPAQKMTSHPGKGPALACSRPYRSLSSDLHSPCTPRSTCPCLHSPSQPIACPTHINKHFNKSVKSKHLPHQN